MEVEFMAELTEATSHDRTQQIIKGKRTKRQRPCYSTTADDSDCLIDNFTPDDDDDDQSPVTSTEEDEDMANCLIMLAQSVSPINKSDQIRRKFTDEICVYECKTCNRKFPSFQALGGHRASHKKPKVNVEEKKSISLNIPSPLTEYSEEDHDQQKTVIVDEENKRSNNNIKGKVHECSICGSEFSSGQALGGHMRKHRLIINRTDSVMEKSPGGSTSTLSLDLNFPPAPEVVDDVQSKFQFTGGSSQQQHLQVFSAPALVDCHY